MFGFSSDSSTVREDEGTGNVCVVLLTPVSFSAPITLQLLYEDGTGNNS